MLRRISAGWRWRWWRCRCDVMVMWCDVMSDTINARRSLCTSIMTTKNFVQITTNLWAIVCSITSLWTTSRVNLTPLTHTRALSRLMLCCLISTQHVETNRNWDVESLKYCLSSCSAMLALSCYECVLATLVICLCSSPLLHPHTPAGHAQNQGSGIRTAGTAELAQLCVRLDQANGWRAHVAVAWGAATTHDAAWSIYRAGTRASVVLDVMWPLHIV